jgi:chorismate mutase/prephenate dehydratase
MKVGYQGSHGTFSEIAALEYFKGQSIEQIGYRNFPSILKDTECGAIAYALLPVENTTTGIISRTYDLFKDYAIHAIGEINVPIRENLITVKGTSLSQIKQVYSHPEALAQCQGFFDQHPDIEPVTYQDTAKSVEYIRSCNDPSKAALASWRAAEYYGMESLIENVQDSETNMTRFLAISAKDTVSDSANKISMMLVLKHHPGSLYNTLGILSKNGININRLESRPIPGKVFQYQFYIDFEGNTNDSEMKSVLKELEMRCEECHLFGCYKAAENISE